MVASEQLFIYAYPPPPPPVFSARGCFHEKSRAGDRGNTQAYSLLWAGSLVPPRAHDSLIPAAMGWQLGAAACA